MSKLYLLHLIWKSMMMWRTMIWISTLSLGKNHHLRPLQASPQRLSARKLALKISQALKCIFTIALVMKTQVTVRVRKKDCHPKVPAKKMLRKALLHSFIVSMEKVIRMYWKRNPYRMKLPSLQQCRVLISKRQVARRKMQSAGGHGQDILWQIMHLRS